jgi:hypothetical protein
LPWIRIERARELSIRQHVPMTLPTDPAEGPDRVLSDFIAEIESEDGPSLTAAEHRMLAADTDHDKPTVKQHSGEPGETDTERAVRRAALDEMVRIAEDAGMYVRAARPRPMR